MDPSSSSTAETIQQHKQEDSSSYSIAEGESDGGLQPYLTFRERVYKLFHTHKFQIAVIVLVIIDCMLVITELLIDIEILRLHEEESTVAITLHYLSIAILSVFIIEIGFKLYAYRMDFFRHKLEVFDAFVVLLSFILDVTFVEQEESAASGVGLIIVLRLWRVARILNGIVLSVKTQAEGHLVKERHLREVLEQELAKSRDYCMMLEQEVESLRALLHVNGINPPPRLSEGEDGGTEMGTNLKVVVAEVNVTANGDK